MNELQRQLYLSALGLDTYMPRWQLAVAPVSVACPLPISSDLAIFDVEKVTNVQSTSTVTSPRLDIPRDNQTISINSLISDIFETKKVVKTDTSLPKVTPQSISSAIEPTIEAFSLSVWRPIDNLMIIDSRNTKLALPTDALLKNLLSRIFPKTSLMFKEEVLRCPMIENSFAKRTADDARAELQTWLSVQCEIKPISYIWLMGANAANYLVKDSEENLLWQPTSIADSNVQALILPSLNELLMNPLLKKPLFSAIRQYHS